MSRTPGATAWPPGVSLLTSGRPILGTLTLLLFSYGLVGLVGFGWMALVPGRESPALLRRIPIAESLLVDEPTPGFLGGGSHGVSLSVLVGGERLSVERIDPIVPNSPRIVLQRTVRAFAWHVVALLFSLLAPRLARRKPA